MGMGLPRAEWVWMPHAGHLIVGNNCRFHLNTYVGDYVVSTVGEYLPDAPVREILAQRRDINLTGQGDNRRADYMEKIGYEEIGFGRLYETMVFMAEKHSDGLCCPFRMKDGGNVDFAGYSKPEKAWEGHLKMCEKWAKGGRPWARVVTTQS